MASSLKVSGRSGLKGSGSSNNARGALFEALESRRLFTSAIFDASNVFLTPSGGNTVDSLLPAIPSTITLAAPVASGPGNGTSPGPVLTTNTPTFAWSAITGNTGYQINLHNSTANTTTSYQIAANATSFTLPASVLVASDLYVWNVRGLTGTASGPPSNYLYFQAMPAVTLAAPVASGPGSSSAPGTVLTTNTPTFTWSAITGITGYQINLHDSTANTSTSYEVGASATSFTLPANVLVAGDQYVWNVRGLNGTASGPPSNYLYFQAMPAVTLAAPVASGPGNSSAPGTVLTTNTPTFTWSAITGITGYQINLHDNTANTSTSYQVGASVTSFTLPSGVLVAGDQYVWNVRGLNGTASGPPSNYLYFQAMPAVTIAAPVAVGTGSSSAPGTVLTTNTPTFTWSAITGISGYQINLHDSTANTSTSYQVEASVTSFTLPANVLVAGDQYVWNVRGLNGTASGPPSNYLYFQAMPAVTLAAPVASGPGSSSAPGTVLTTNTPTFTWSAITGVTGYQINLHNITTGTATSYQTSANTTSFMLPSGVLISGDRYVWNVRGLNGTISGPPSNYLYFQAPPLPALTAPAAVGPGSSTSPGPLLSTLTPTFTWGAVIGATGYQVNLYDQTSRKNLSYQVDADTTSLTIPTGTLAPGDAFVWNVRELQGVRSGPPSVYLYFRTPSPAVAAAELNTALKAVAAERVQTDASILTATPDSARYIHLEHKLHDENKEIKSMRNEAADLKKLL